MSIVMALSLVLCVGFLATGLVGFLGWRERMRGGPWAPITRTRTQDQHAGGQAEDEHYGFEGAGL